MFTASNLSEELARTAARPDVSLPAPCATSEPSSGSITANGGCLRRCSDLWFVLLLVIERR